MVLSCTCQEGLEARKKHVACELSVEWTSAEHTSLKISLPFCGVKQAESLVYSWSCCRESKNHSPSHGNKTILAILHPEVSSTSFPWPLFVCQVGWFSLGSENSFPQSSFQAKFHLYLRKCQWKKTLKVILSYCIIFQ